MTEVVLKFVEDYVEKGKKRKLIVFPKIKNQRREAEIACRYSVAVGY